MNTWSTGARNAILAAKNIRTLFNRGCAKMLIFGGTPPADSDAAATGTLLATITNGSLTSKAKQKIRFTPATSGTTGTFWINLNGTVFTFKDDGSPAVAEACTGLYRLINTAQGTAAKYFTNSTDGAITAGGSINIPDIFQAFTLTDNGTSLDIESATAGVSFDYDSGATGAGNSIAMTVIASDAYGLQFEAAADVSGGILEKLASQTWSGKATATGIASHYRFVLDADTGVSSTSEIRIQGSIGTSGTDGVINTVQFTKDATYTVDNASIPFPAS